MMLDHEPFTSPRSTQLQADLAQAKVAVLEDSRNEVGKTDAALIEPISGNSRDRLVTFLYRQDPGEVKIGLVSNLKDGVSGRLIAASANICEFVQ